MRLPTLRRSAVVATIAAAALVGAGSAATATDLTEDDYCSANPGVVSPPAEHEVNHAPTPQDIDATALVNGTSVVDVLDEDSATDVDGDEVHLIQVGDGAHGTACIDGDSLVYEYDDEDADSDDPPTTDTIQYVVTDGDYYRTATVNLDLYQVKSFAPKVKQKAIVKNGKLTRKATITFYNADTQYPVHVMYGDPNSDSDPAETVLQPGTENLYTAKTITTAKRYLEFFTYVYEAHNVAYVQDAITDSITGKTVVASMDDEDYRAGKRFDPKKIFRSHHR